jgi:hypothetical protein
LGDESDMRGLSGIALDPNTCRGGVLNDVPQALGGCCQQNPVTPSEFNLLRLSEANAPPEIYLGKAIG